MFRSITLALLINALVLTAQVQNPTQQAGQVAVSQSDAQVPIFRVEVVERTTAAVNYLHRGGSTKVAFKATPLMASSKGEAKVESERGVIHVSAKFEHMAPPSSFGPEYLTYVLWAISPDGRPVNLGELTLSDYGKGSDSSIDATSDIQTFGLIVTAEPYYGVTQPSDVVVLENAVRPDTQGVVETINARYELLPRGMYTSQAKAGGFVPVRVGKKDPFELYEAENAVQLSRIAGADKYASDSFQQALGALDQARKYQSQHPGQKPVITMAREAVVRAEDARVVAIRRERDEAETRRLNEEKQKAEAARIQAQDEARRRAQAEAERSAAETAKKEAVEAANTANRDRAAAETAKLQADQARQAAEQARHSAEEAREAALAQQQQLAAAADKSRLAAAEADRQRQAALDQQQQLTAEADKARQAAAEADRQRQDAEQQQAQLRQQLLLQLNAVLQTRDTARGLIVNMSDVLFDTAQYTLKPGAREKLAKVSGIILAHPGLKIEVEGHTDSIGGDDYNMKLSDNRANAVRAYLVGQGLKSESITAKGFGKTTPVADNGTAAGRQMNRRVELVVSGDIMGTSIDSTRTSTYTIKP
ncbi:MAG TPA: OmpA family protein [Bryobacteraceae bacterium]|jgi:outer membrane protein OmpA-like peptidoglycan-associated protein